MAVLLSGAGFYREHEWAQALLLSAPNQNRHATHARASRKSYIKPPGMLFFFQALLKGAGGRLFNWAKRIIGSKNTAVRDRVDLRVVQVTVNSI